MTAECGTMSLVHFTNRATMQAGFGIRSSGFAEQIPEPESFSANPESRIPNPACWASEVNDGQ